ASDVRPASLESWFCGCRSLALSTWPWNPRVFIGNLCGTFSKVIFRSFWQTPSTSRPFPDAGKRGDRRDVPHFSSLIVWRTGERSVCPPFLVGYCGFFC